MKVYAPSDKSSEQALSEAIGKRIDAITLGDDDALHIHFTDGSGITFFDAGQDCCEKRYMRTDDDMQSFVGSKLTGAEIKEAPDGEENGESHEVQFLEIQTDRGVFTMASHNEHNGYYGGFLIRVKAA
jgi:hypothetical protein